MPDGHRDFDHYGRCREQPCQCGGFLCLVPANFLVASVSGPGFTYTCLQKIVSLNQNGAQLPLPFIYVRWPDVYPGWPVAIWQVRPIACWIGYPIMLVLFAVLTLGVLRKAFLGLAVAPQFHNKFHL